MKRWNMLYDNCRLPIRIMFVAFVFLAIGYLIQNDNLNVFYTIDNTYIQLTGQILYRIGNFLVINMPLIFMINLVAKRANSGMPALLAIIGYATFMVTTMFLNDHSLVSQAYTNALGLSHSTSSDTYYPIQTGMIGSFAVALITRYSYLTSRKKSIYSFFGFMNEDSRAILYNVVLCLILGFVTVLVWPYFIEIIVSIMTWIAEDISDPYRLAAYGLLDRSLSILGLGNLIRYPFWYGASGGTYAAISGATVLGDVNIWAYMPDALLTYSGAGRFITPYYIINIFALPAMYLGMYFTISDKKERHRHLLFLVGACFVSIICGNPLPLELLLLFTSPLLLIFHLMLSASLFGILSLNGAFLGFEYSGSTVSAMPGALVDYLINIRIPEYTHTILVILMIGIIFAIIYFLMTAVYYRYLAYDVIGSDRSNIICSRLFDAVGGSDNIKSVSSALFSVTVELYETEKISYDEIKKVGAKKITENKTSLVLDFGSASTVIRIKIQKALKKLTRA